MSSNRSDKVTTVVTEMGPGWVYVKAADPKPAPELIEGYLKRTIHDWFDDHPQFIYDRAQPFLIYGELQGIHVWYHVAGQQPQPSTRAAERRVAFDMRVHPQIAQRHSNEYLEAVYEDALEIFVRAYQDGKDTLVVINRSRVAILLDNQTKQGAVLPAEFIESVVDPTMSERFRAWLANPSQPFYVMHIEGSWFGRDIFRD